MPAEVSGKPETPLRRRHASVLLLVLCLVGAYSLVYALSYLTSPIGRFPLLDAAENVKLAEQIAGGTLPAEPFFRAMLYPGLLALLLRGGVTVDWLPVLAALLGCLFHVGSSLSVYAIARRAWRSPKAGLIAALIFGLNPVAVYFAAEPMDTTLGLFLFLAGLNVLHACFSTTRSAQSSALPLPRLAFGVALWSLAALARPHYLLVLLGLPFLLAILLWRAPKKLAVSTGTIAIVAIVFFGAVGLIQQRVSGHFRVMPTQGAFSLWVGNRPGANGRYYEQQIHLTAESLAEGENPARIESELLYKRGSGTTGPVEVDAMNHYWRAKTIAAIQADPATWLGLMARKAYYLLNNFEQYNNKTFAVQKGLSPVLRFNPLGWGMTFVLTAAAGVLMLRERRSFAGWPLFLAAAGIYSAGTVLFFVSDRFRLPLLPFLCIGAGALGCFSAKRLLQLCRAHITPLSITVLLAALLTFSRGWGVYDIRPATQDYVLLSIAAGKAGQDVEALGWARKALEVREGQPDALACAVMSYYNAMLQGFNPSQRFPGESWDLQNQRFAQIPGAAPRVRLVNAVALWKTGKADAAGKELRSLLENEAPDKDRMLLKDDALGVLLLAGLQSSAEESLARNRGHDTRSFYLASAINRRPALHVELSPNRQALVAQTEPFVRNIFN